MLLIIIELELIIVFSFVVLIVTINHLISISRYVVTTAAKDIGLKKCKRNMITKLEILGDKLNQIKNVIWIIIILPVMRKYMDVEE